MPCFQYRTIPRKDLEKYPDWQVITSSTERSTSFYCDRSKLPLDKCENVECARLKTHRSKTKIEDVELVTICKTESVTVP